MKHAIFPRVKPLDGIIWNCECSESGFDVYDLATHANNVIDQLRRHEFVLDPNKPAPLGEGRYSTKFYRCQVCDKFEDAAAHEWVG